MNAKIENINGITNITKKKGVPLKILQLTDIHIGGSFSTRKKDKLALQAVEKIVNASDADFVIVTGDMVYPIPWLLQGSFNNLKSSKKFAACMEKLGKPWTVVFGNHDSEVWATASKKKIGDFYSSCKNCYFSQIGRASCRERV